MSPSHQALIQSNAVTLRAGQFIDPDDPDNKDHLYTYWCIRAFPAPYTCVTYDSKFCYKAYGTDLTLYELTDLTPGKRYAWMVAYADSDTVSPIFSEERIFIVGDSKPDSHVKIKNSANASDFRMVSFIQWPDNPSAMHVFGDELNGVYDI